MFDMSPSEFVNQQANVIRNQKVLERSILLSEKEHKDMERAMQWPEDLAAYDKLNTPTLLTEVSI